MADGTGFDDLADELYGLPLTDFTAARTAAITSAKLDGDQELARRIGELRKPSVVGWLANQLVRRHPDELTSLVELGDSLREAMRRLDGEQIRASGARQQQVVHALVQQALGLADATGHAVSDATKRGLEQTLHAALADPQAATELTAGRLTGSLSRSGFPDLQITEQAPARPSADTGTAAGKADKKAADKAAQDEEKRAQAEADHATRALAEAQQSVEEIERSAHAARQQVEQVRAQLDEALDEQARTEDELRKARGRAREAERAVRLAERRLANATARRPG